MGMSLRHHCITGVALAAVGFALTGPALAQKSGGILKTYSSDNPTRASILEESTIVTLLPYMAAYNNPVMFEPESKQQSMASSAPDLAQRWSWCEAKKTQGATRHPQRDRT